MKKCEKSRFRFSQIIPVYRNPTLTEKRKNMNSKRVHNRARLNWQIAVISLIKPNPSINVFINIQK